MKKIIAVAFAFLPLMGMAQQRQVAKYQTFIYTSADLANEIQQVNHSLDKEPDRRFSADMVSPALNAGKGIASGYVTSFIDMGVNAIASLITRNSRLQSEWLTTVEAENTCSTNINTIEDVKDFYNTFSTSGALDPQGMRFDGILTAKEISILDLRGPDLVVLSACETGLGEVTGDGVFGLQRGFKKTGAQTLMMSLWKVDDDATQMLMSQFYTNLAKGENKFTALKNAQSYVRTYDNDKYSDPTIGRHSYYLTRRIKPVEHDDVPFPVYLRKNK